MKSVNIKKVEDGRKSYYQNATWRRVFLLLPQICDLTGRLMWFKFAFKGTVLWTVADEVTWRDVRYADITELGMRGLTQDFSLNFHRG